MKPEHEKRLQEIEDRLAEDRQRLKEVEALWKRVAWTAFGVGLAAGLLVGFMIGQAI